ncbi:hypothetical protein XELAEV_18002360mg [Xenopus laevis]|nr:hypothetical protein XELAEV_18002360mg [Xenopus laevis]
MHKEHLAQDENSNPREGPGSRKKDKLSPSEQDMNHINKSKAKSGYWDYESQYRDGKRKEWVPRPGGGSRTQRSRNGESFNSTECVAGRPEQPGVEKEKTVQTPVISRQPSPPAKEEQTTDSWLLFKPLPVFPVDSSSARTLPKISYASKVKENLDSKGLVPSSALRTSNSLPNCLLSSTVANSHPTSPAQTSLYSSSCSSLSSTPPSPVSQDNLGAIFQNEWGLSFINEPGAGQAPVESHGLKDGPIGEKEEGQAATPVCVLDRLKLCGFYVDTVEDDAAGLENPRDWESMVQYSMREWNVAWTIHKKDPSRVVVYAESMDGKG